jgi:aspartyl protease family protein
MQALAKLAVFWVLFMAALAYFFQDWEGEKRNPNQTVSVTSEGELVLKRNRQGHYVSQGLINNSGVVFMLDTGATNVVIPYQVAERLNLRLGREGTAYTANGPVKVFQTQIDQLTLGNIVLSNVPASINMGDQTDQILLGMSVLGKLDFRQNNGYLYLKPMTAY